MTRSGPPSKTIDLDRDLPTTREDVAALRLARRTGTLDPEGYLEFLSRLPPAAASALRARPGPRGEAPFDLID